MKYYWVRHKSEGSTPIVVFVEHGRVFVTVGYYDKTLSPSNNYTVQSYDVAEYEIIGTIEIQDTLSRNQKQEDEAIAAYKRGEYINLADLIAKLQAEINVNGNRGVRNK